MFVVISNSSAATSAHRDAIGVAVRLNVHAAHRRQVLKRHPHDLKRSLLLGLVHTLPLLLGLRLHDHLSQQSRFLL